MLEVYVM